MSKHKSWDLLKDSRNGPAQFSKPKLGKPRCEDCVNWDKLWSHKGFAQCNVLSYGEDNKVIVDLYVDDDSGLDLKIITHKDFHCSSFKRKC